MTRAVFQRIREDDLIYMRQGTIVYASHVARMLDPDVLERLLTIIGDNIGDGVDGEEIEWAGVADDCRKEGWL